MEKDIEYYKQHPIEYLEEVCDIKLFNWQKQILNIIINEKKTLYWFGHRYGKRQTTDAYKRIMKELFNKEV